jgi:hypothetical protein
MRLILALGCVLYASMSYSVPWPIMIDPRITSCRDNNTAGMGPCSQAVYYSNSGVQFVDINAVGTPNVGSVNLFVKPAGVHCAFGNGLNGDLPYRTCTWRDENVHRPLLTGTCRLRDLTSWTLTPDSTCSVFSAWGGHAGAGPGGECVVFTNSVPIDGAAVVNTPWGPLTADQAANGGNRFCSKPLPPSVTCELQLPSVIDHGPVRAGETSKREDNGSVNCGGSPKIDVLVNGDRDTGGVRIAATPFVVNPTTVRITSEINVSSSAVPGEHSATYVFVASPY